ncbi:MAG: hypothetical protein ACTSWY_13500 [Promethearchaeota archaeon]
MPNNQIQRFYVPIKTVQTTLSKFDCSLPEPKNRDLMRVVEESELKNKFEESIKINLNNQ